MASSSSSAAAVMDASFLNAADQCEELKAADLETGGSASASILPLEIEDGAAAKKGEKAEGGKVLEGDGATAIGTPTKPAKGFCARCVLRLGWSSHCGRCDSGGLRGSRPTGSIRSPPFS